MSSLLERTAVSNIGSAFFNVDVRVISDSTTMPFQTRRVPVPPTFFNIEPRPYAFLIEAPVERVRTSDSFCQTVDAASAMSTFLAAIKFDQDESLTPARVTRMRQLSTPSAALPEIGPAYLKTMDSSATMTEVLLHLLDELTHFIAADDKSEERIVAHTEQKFTMEWASRVYQSAFRESPVQHFELSVNPDDFPII